MNYIDALAARIAKECGDDWEEISRNEQRLYRLYAVLGRAKKGSVTWEDVHDAWSAWRSDMMPEHRSIISFRDLTPEVQSLDRPYTDAIRRAVEPT